MSENDASALADAELYLAINYLYGSEDIKQNKHLAIFYLEKSATKGNKKAALLLKNIDNEKSQPAYPSRLIHKTANNIYVRSKSEVIIANALFFHEVSFVYEQKITFRKGIEFIPDFTVHLANGEVLIWEHLGLISDDKYLNKWLKKKSIYESYGFNEGTNLFVTLDEKDGSIDSRYIHKLARDLKDISRK